MAAERGSVPATAAAASAMVQSWLTANGIPAPELILENGSGLSRNERISAITLARVLQRAWQSPTMPEFVASLPIAGIDGTMKKRVQALGVMGNAHIKTGSLIDVASMAGYVTARSGRHLLVVCMVNHANAGATRAGFDLLLQWVYENG
jgi:D-alanyl-D-alanine carboxypeptidase/D-alanyl-D-alanine-endopeptidase (penicillin-binding protein 4)